jgi:hypothetical protein
MKRPIFVIIKVYIIWILQVIFYYSPFSLYFMRLYLRSFYQDWLREKIPDWLVKPRNDASLTDGVGR